MPAGVSHRTHASGMAPPRPEIAVAEGLKGCRETDWEGREGGRGLYGRGLRPDFAARTQG